MECLKRVFKPLLGTYDVDGSPKPFLRGKVHLALTLTVPIWGSMLIEAGKHHPWTLIHAWITVVSMFVNFGASALLHNFKWSPRKYTVIQHLDHVGIYMMISGSAAPYYAHFPPWYWVAGMGSQWAFMLVGTILVMTGQLDDPDPAEVSAFLEQQKEEPILARAVDAMEDAIEKIAGRKPVDFMLVAPLADDKQVMPELSSDEEPLLTNLVAPAAPASPSGSLSEEQIRLRAKQIANQIQANEKATAVAASTQGTPALEPQQGVPAPGEGLPVQRSSFLQLFQPLPEGASVLEIASQRRSRRATLYIVMGLCNVFLFPAFFISLMPFEICMLGGLAVMYITGAVVYALRVPDFMPFVFGFHELFHIFCALSGYCTLLGDVSALQRFNPDEHLMKTAAHWFF